MESASPTKESGRSGPYTVSTNTDETRRRGGDELIISRPGKRNRKKRDGGHQILTGGDKFLVTKHGLGVETVLMVGRKQASHATGLRILLTPTWVGPKAYLL